MTRPLRKGDLILVPFPFTDLTAVKYRPAVILTPEPIGPDLVVAYLSSVIPEEPLPPSHLLVSSVRPSVNNIVSACSSSSVKVLSFKRERILAFSSAWLNGLVRKSSAPASIPRSLSASSPRAVIRTIGTKRVSG